ncbi:hypothetical protein RIF29_00377 [Crotalaria pallida]|uniref:Uncharacterized protein n=1 Tax=Crotalaria pallida TaxID=3830 RepID=A0AAN9IXF9_CROPI
MQKKENVGRENNVMHATESGLVRFSTQVHNEKGRSETQITSSRTDTEVVPRRKKETVMKGFDLGTEIIISPNLLAGVGVKENKGVKPNGRPPDMKPGGKFVPNDSKGQLGDKGEMSM